MSIALVVASLPFGAAQADVDPNAKPQPPVQALDNLPKNMRQRQLKQFAKRKSLVDQLSKADMNQGENFALYEIELLALKKMTERLLNAPLIDWPSKGIDYKVAELQDKVSSDFSGMETLPLWRRAFTSDEYKLSEEISIGERQKIFLSYQSSLKSYKRHQIFLNREQRNKNPNIWRKFHLKLNMQGATSFDLFAMEEKFDLVRHKDGLYEVLAPLQEDVQIELEALSQIKTTKNWKVSLKHAALSLLMKKWVALDEVWLPGRFKTTKRVSVLPESCRGQFFSMHPLLVPKIMNEKKHIPVNLLFEGQFVTLLKESNTVNIPVTTNLALTESLINAVPSWKANIEVYRADGEAFAEAEIDQFNFSLSALENQYTRYVLAWYLKHFNRDMYHWDMGQVRAKLEEALIESKKYALLVSLEVLLLADPDAAVSPGNKKRIIEVIEAELVNYRSKINDAVEEILNLYTISREVTELTQQEFETATDPKERVKLLVETSGVLAEKMVLQDKKIEILKRGEQLGPIEDTPVNFQLATVVLSDLLKDVDVQEASFEQISKIFVQDETYKPLRGEMPDGTYESAKKKFAIWKVKNHQGFAEVHKLAELFQLEGSMPLNGLFEDPKLRITFEETKKSQLNSESPILTSVIAYEGEEKALYQLLYQAIKSGSLEEVKMDLVQRAVWKMKVIVDFEVDRFCKMDPETLPGLKHLLTNSSFRREAFSQSSKKDANQKPLPNEFEKVNEALMDELAKQLERSPVEEHVGTGFLILIAAGLLTGPMSRIPFVGRFTPRIHRVIMGGLHWLGLPAGLLAMRWIVRDYVRYFVEEKQYINALENFSEAQIHGVDHAATITDVLELSNDSKSESDSLRDHKSLLHSRGELLVYQIPMALMAPVFLVFFKNMFGFGHELVLSRKFAWAQRASMARALKRLYVPTNAGWKAGGTLPAMHATKLRGAFGKSLDKVMQSWTRSFQSLRHLKNWKFWQKRTSTEVLSDYMERYLVALREDLARHEMQFGKTAAQWSETVAAMESKVDRMWFPRHISQNAYWGSLSRGEGKLQFERMTHERLRALVAVERQELLCNIKLFEDGVHAIKTKGTANISELSLGETFAETLGKFQTKFGPEFSRFNFLLEEGEALTYVVGRIESQRLGSIWMGSWVGYQGPLGRAIRQAESYRYILTHQVPYLKANGLLDVSTYIILYRAAEQALLSERMAQGMKVNVGEITPKEIQKKMFEMSSGFFKGLKVDAINLVIEKRMAEGLPAEVEFITEQEMKEVMMDMILHGTKPKKYHTEEWNWPKSTTQQN